VIVINVNLLPVNSFSQVYRERISMEGRNFFDLVEVKNTGLITIPPVLQDGIHFCALSNW
jgi:hypothetical protein